MPYGYYGFYWMDYTYIFVIIGAVICLIASAGMNSDKIVIEFMTRF